eukprot:TRINITY_DN4311_c0_g1_i2.p1 TRINITY_DN4311_c0_g1~~TRINITY_DN4311_c0_g1_i2.p1  ORF type:complete len:500 (-),score=78.37 TRINITY_DN4311_c0_g1_i2:583-2082(-)
MISKYDFNDRQTPSRADDNTFRTIFMNQISQDRIKGNLKHLTAIPNLAGTDSNHQNAEWLAEQWQRAGLKTTLQRFPTLLNYPIHRSLRITSPTSSAFTASLQEQALPEDLSSINPSIVPTFNGYSGSGKVTSSLVYANYGRVQDFAHLVEAGVNIRGKIVITRYGKIFRGNKALLAEKHGAAGVLIYSDPEDSGPTEDILAYPEGPLQPAFGAQRGSVWAGDGDPGTPGWASTASSARLDTAQVLNGTSPHMNGYYALPNIPILPISWSDAAPFLRAMNGKLAPAEWNGGGSFQYRLDVLKDDDLQVELDILMSYEVKEIVNVFAQIEGEYEPDRTVIMGGHHDAWVFGAVDNLGSTTIILEVGLAFAHLLRSTDWRPRRSILLAAWDCEEYGLEGSTEFVEGRTRQLSTEAVAYINLDVAVTGPANEKKELSVRSTPNFKALMSDVAASFEDSVDYRQEQWRSLGSGSDFAPFLQVAGVSCVDIGLTVCGKIYRSGF